MKDELDLNDQTGGEANGESGSVWTTYSDLFSNMSIVFLVLFVFALLKAGISSLNSLRTVKETKEFLDGKLSKREKDKIEKQKIVLGQSMKEMDQYNNVISAKILELNQLSGKLKGHKDILNGILDQQKMREAVIGSLRENIHKQKQDIEQQKTKIDELKNILTVKESESENLKREKLQNEESIQALQKNIEQLTVEQQKLLEQNQFKEKENQEKLANLDQEISFLKGEKSKLETDSQGLKQDIDLKIQEITSLKENLTTTSMKLQNEEGVAAGLLKETGVLKQELGGKISEINDLKAKNDQLGSTLGDMKGQYSDLQRDLLQMKEANGQLNQKMAGLLGEMERGKMENSSLNRENGRLSDQLKDLKGEMEKFGQGYGDLLKSNAALKAENLRWQGDLEGLKKSHAGLDGKFQDLLTENNRLKGELAGLAEGNRQLQQKMDDLKNQNNSLVVKTEACQDEKSQLVQEMNLLKNQNLAAVAAAPEGERGGLRSSLGKNIAGRLNGSHGDIQVDSMTGNVILPMDESFLFKKNSHELSDLAKEKLRTIIPVYAEELFKNEAVKDKILSVDIVGHASPTFRGAYVDPESPHPEAFNYNLDLSTKRSMEIVEFIFGREFGDFKFRMDLRKRIQAIGKSYSLPVMEKNSPEPCGPFHCQLSRRVEISFSLKEDKALLEGLQKLQKE